MRAVNVWTVTKKNLQQMKRDPRLIALSIIAPIIVTALFGSVFGGELTNLKVIIINDDEGFDDVIADEISNQMKLNSPNPLIFFNKTSDPAVAQAAVVNNYSQAAIIYPETFTDDLLLGESTNVNLIVSYNNSASAEYIISLFQTSSGQVMEKYFGKTLFKTTITPLYKSSAGTLPNQINISLCNPDKGYTKSLFSDEIYDILDENETMALEEGNNLKEAKQKVIRGEARAIIIFSEDFTYNALIKKEINIDLKLDGAEPQACGAIALTLSDALAEAFSDKFDKSSFNIDDYYFNNPDGHNEPVEAITYFTPAILCFIVFFFSFLLTMLSFLRERNQGTMERILTSPLKRTEFILGYVLSFSILAIVQATSVILTTILLFNAQIEYTFLTLLQAYLIIYLIVIGALGLGIFLSTLAKTEFQILQFIPLIIIPFMLLSGVWAPVESLPEWLQPISALIPLTYSNRAMRNILLRGESILDVLLLISIYAIFAVLMIILGVLKLNRKLK
ncbi:MAG: ABC transporter permease [Promethearchaeota archaeon]